MSSTLHGTGTRVIVTGVSATVEAAIIGGCFGLIGVGGTVWVAVTGFRANRRIAADTMSAERGRALWEKRCTAYEEIIAILRERQAFRSGVFLRASALTANRTSEPLGILKRYTDDLTDPTTAGPQSRILAYASPAVRRAYDELMKADLILAARLSIWQTSFNTQQVQEAAEKLAVPLGLSPITAPDDAWNEAQEALADVLEKDEMVIGLIRRELGSDPG